MFYSVVNMSLRSSCSQMFFKKGVLLNFLIFTGKQLCWSLFLIKLRACNFNKKEIPSQVFSCEICEILQNTSSGCLWRLQFMSNDLRKLFMKVALGP